MTRVVAALAVTALVFGVVFSYRTDYLGHYLGGFGGTLLVLSPVVAIGADWRGWATVALTITAIGVGFGTESTIFELAIFDPVDFCNQSLGATVAGAATFRARSGIGTAAALAVLALATMIGGFYFAFL